MPFLKVRLRNNWTFLYYLEDYRYRPNSHPDCSRQVLIIWACHDAYSGRPGNLCDDFAFRADGRESLRHKYG